MYTKIRWYDWLVYRLYHWRWGKILKERADLREIIIKWMKAYDVLDSGTDYKVSLHIEPIDEKESKV